MLNLISIVLLIFAGIAVVAFLTTFFWGLYLYFDSDGDRDLIKTVTNNPRYGYSILITVISFVLIFSLNGIKTKILRDNTNETFTSFNNSKDKIYLNHKLLKNDSIIMLLKNIKKESTGRNTGITVINIKLIHNNKITYFMLLRDFSDYKKYWVKIKKTELDESGFCIGEINTSQFDTIKDVDKTKNQ